MKHAPYTNFGITVAGVMALNVFSAHAGTITTTADTFGSGANAFTIDFVTVGNPGNTYDAGAVGGPYGGVSYIYRMGSYEIPQDAITKATVSGMTNVTAGAWAGSQPGASMTWLEAVAFVNWLNTSTGHPVAYDIGWTGSAWGMNLWPSAQAWQTDGENLYRNKDAYYFLASENEWYKAAYHQNDGVTANYWDYATGSDTIPTPVLSGTTAGTAVYNQHTVPASVDQSGGLGPYGTRGQSGNAFEWVESAYDGYNNSTSEFRAIRGGGWTDSAYMRSSQRNGGLPAYTDIGIGFRIASVATPEPSSSLLLLGSGWMWLLKRRRRPAR